MYHVSTRAVLVLVECGTDGQPTSPSLATVSFARELCKKQKADFSLLWFSTQGTRPSPLLCQLGATELLHCELDGAAPPLAEICAPTLARLARERSASHVIAAATSFGKDVLPRVAGLLDSAYVGDCIGVDATPTGLRYTRPIHAGNLTVECEAASACTIVSVRSSEFSPAAVLPFAPCPDRTIAPSVDGHALGRIRQLGFEPVASTRPALTEAECVVAGGRALGARFFEVLGPLADRLGAALGATRAMCDEGLVPGDFQVGQTGKIVAPKLYVAVGISGAVQHVAGMRGARTIVAINVDPDAPIFAVADYGLVGDLFEVVPALTRALEGLDRGTPP